MLTIQAEKRWHLKNPASIALTKWMLSTATAKVHPALMDSIKYAHDEPKHYHYFNKQNMIYKIVLGIDTKRFREMNNLEKVDVLTNIRQQSKLKLLRRYSK